MNRNALIKATIAGLVLQLAMVVAGHFVPMLREQGFAVGGMLFSLCAGVLYVRLTRGPWPVSLAGGAVAGGVCGFLGIAVSCLLGDVPPTLLLFGTLGSTVAGLAGGALGKVLP